MASGYHPFHMEHYLQPSLSVDSRRGFFDDDEASILDENILDNNMLESSSLECSPIDRRRSGSDMASNGIFSPGANDWDFDHDMGIPAGPADDSSMPAATFEHSHGTNNPFIKLEQAQPAYAHQNNGGWASNGGGSASGSCTPVPYDNNGYPGPFDEGVAYLAPGPAPGPFEGGVHITPHAVFQPAGPVPSIPSSPAVKEWGQPTTADHNELPKRMRQQSPAPRSHTPLHVVRRDGIRKKNARFDIPAERTLMNIDQLISRSHDETEIKELKQQKRLLRNRQAALDSRQRKKQHTERLEEEKKHHGAVIQELEEKLQAMQMREEQMNQRFDEVLRERDFLHHKSETLQLEKEDMVRCHTLETGDLRKKNSYLEDQIHKLEETMDRNMVSAPSSTGFSDGFTLDSDYGLDNDCWSDPMSLHSPEMPTVKTEKTQAFPEPEKPAQQAPAGMLLLLLLCGAFVASSSHKGPLPQLRIPSDVQSASENVLRNLYHEAGVDQPHRLEAVDPSPTSNWAIAKSETPQKIGLGSDILHSINNPSADQQQEQLAQLTAAEYNEVTSNNYLRDPEPAPHRGRRRLDETLAAMRSNNGGKQSAAEVYTRSLLWDRVDAEVVRRFAAFARQAQEQSARSNDNDGIQAGPAGMKV